MTNKDEPSKTPTQSTQSVNESLFVYSPRTTVNNTNGSSSSSGNWFRSIQRRIRKFISKQSRHKHLEQTSNDFNKTNAINSNDDTDGLDETNLYSIVDQLGNGNDEEVAMIRATAQMAR